MRIAVLGDGRVGKSSLIKWLIHWKCPWSADFAVGGDEDCMLEVLLMEADQGRECTFEIVEVPTATNCKSLQTSNAWLHSVDALILVHNLQQPKSHLKLWQIYQNACDVMAAGGFSRSSSFSGIGTISHGELNDKRFQKRQPSNQYKSASSSRSVSESHHRTSGARIPSLSGQVLDYTINMQQPSKNGLNRLPCLVVGTHLDSTKHQKRTDDELAKDLGCQWVNMTTLTDDGTSLGSLSYKELPQQVFDKYFAQLSHMSSVKL